MCSSLVFSFFLDGRRAEVVSSGHIDAVGFLVMSALARQPTHTDTVTCRRVHPTNPCMSACHLLGFPENPWATDFSAGRQLPRCYTMAGWPVQGWGRCEAQAGCTGKRSNRCVGAISEAQCEMVVPGGASLGSSALDMRRETEIRLWSRAHSYRARSHWLLLGVVRVRSRTVPRQAFVAWRAGERSDSGSGAAPKEPRDFVLSLGDRFTPPPPPRTTV